MAKVKAPLMSLEARGAIGQAVVYFPWKGLNAVRKYVIPTNPKSTAQNTHRARLTSAVSLIHEAIQQATHPLDAADKSAVNLWGSTFATPRTWFNQLCKLIVDAQVLGDSSVVLTDGATTPGAGQLGVSIWNVGNVVGFIKFYYGTTKSCTDGYKDGANAVGNWTATITGLTAGIKYYWQAIVTNPAAYNTMKSGVYHGKPT